MMLFGIPSSEAATSTSSSQSGSDSNANEEVHSPEYFWKEISTVGPEPEGRRQGHTAVALDDYLIFYGGCKLNGECFNDLQILDTTSVQHSGIETMQWMTPTVSLGSGTDAIPVARGGHTASLVGEKMYVFGGKFPSALGGEAVYLSDVYMLSHLESTSNWRVMRNPAVQWDKMDHPGKGDFEPDIRGREGHSAAVYEGRYIYYFGGYATGKEDSNNDEAWMDDLLVLDTRTVNTDKAAWESITQPRGAPPPREGHVAVIVEHKMFIFGGFGDGKSYQDLHSFDMHTRGWEALTPEGNAPQERGGGAAITILGSSILLVGGCDFERKRKCYSDVHTLDVSGLARGTDTVIPMDSNTFRWTSLPVEMADSFTGREGHTLTWSNGRMFVFGGCSFARTCYNDVLELAPLQNSRQACNSKDTSGMFCSGHGECLQRGVPPAQPYFDCECDDGWESSDCSEQMKCPVGGEMKVICSGHGTCTEYKMCKCDDGYFANDCSQQQDITCPAAAAMEGSEILQCAGQGLCLSGKCECSSPWTGLACNILEKCQKGANGQACSGHGECVYPGTMNIGADGSSMSVNRAAETTGILWFESPGVFEQEKDTLEEKQRKASVSFLEISGAHRAYKVSAQNVAPDARAVSAAGPAINSEARVVPGLPGGPPSPDPNEVSDLSVVGKDATTPPTPPEKMPFFYCKCLPGFAGPDCGKSIADPGRFFVKVYMSGESTVDEVTLLKQFYTELLFDKLRLAISDFASVGQDQVLLLSAMTKAADDDQNDKNKRKKGSAARPGQPEAPEANLLLLQVVDKMMGQLHRSSKSVHPLPSAPPSELSTASQATEFAQSTAGDLASGARGAPSNNSTMDRRGTLALGGNASNETELASFKYSIVAELVIRAYGHEEVTVVQDQLVARSDDGPLERIFSHLIELRGWHKGDAGITSFRLVPGGFVPPATSSMQTGKTDQVVKRKTSGVTKSPSTDAPKKYEQGTVIPQVSDQATIKQAVKGGPKATARSTHGHGHRFRGGQKNAMSPFMAEQSLATGRKLHPTSAESCSQSCSNHGYCEKSRCYCSFGWAGTSCAEARLDNIVHADSQLTISSRHGVDAHKAYHWVIGVFTFSFAAAWASPYLLRTIKGFRRQGKEHATWIRKSHGRY
jgi:N-acetylneuraminic acid mutarotase